MAAPLVKADGDGVSVLFGTFAAGPDHSEMLLLVLGLNCITYRKKGVTSRVVNYHHLVSAGRDSGGDLRRRCWW